MDNSSAPRSDSKTGVVREKNLKKDFLKQQEQYGNLLKSYANGHEGQDPINFLHSVRTDSSLMKEISRGVYQQSLQDKDEQEYLDKVGLDREQAIGKTEANIRNVISQHLYKGESVDQSISKHLRTLRDSQGVQPITGVKRLMEDNPKKYQSFLDDNGEVELNESALSDSVRANDDLYKKLSADKFKSFDRELNKKNNQGVITPETANTQPDIYAKTYMVYDKYGSEGLSSYINLYQHYDRDKPYEEQSAEVKKSLDFIHSKDASGQTPQQYIEKTTEGIEFDPVKITENRPADYNGLNSYWYDNGANPTNPARSIKSDSLAFSKMAKSISEEYKSGEYIIKKEGSKEEESWWGYIADHLSPLSWGEGNSPEEQLDELEKEGFPVNVRRDDHQPFFNALVDKEGVDETNFFQEMVRKHSRLLTNPEYKGKVGVKDLMSTIQVYSEKNGGRSVNGDGKPEFAVDYENAPYNVKYALDVMTYRGGLNQLVRKEGSDYILEPFAPQRLERQAEKAVRKNYYLKDGEGLKTDESRVPKDIMSHSFLGGLANFGIMFGRTVDRFGEGEIGRMFIGGFRKAHDWIHALVNGFSGEEWKADPDASKFFDKMYNYVEERNTQYDSRYSSSYLDKGLDYLAPFAYYAMMFKGLGRGVNALAGKGISKTLESKMFSEGRAFVQEMRTAENLSTFKKFANPPLNKVGAEAFENAQIRMNKMASYLKDGGKPSITLDYGNVPAFSKGELVAEKVGSALKGGKGPTTLLDFSTGGAVYDAYNEAVDPEYMKKYSLLGSGIVDIGLHKLGYDTDVEGKFQKLDKTIGGRLLQYGMSVLANETLGMFMDGAIGGVSWTKNRFKLKFGAEDPVKVLKTTVWPEKQFKGLHFNGEEYSKTLDKSQAFTSDLRRLKTHLTSNLDELPHAKFQEGIKNSGYQVGMSARHIENTGDLVKHFTNSIRPLVKDLPQQVRESTEGWHKLFGNGELSSHELDQITDDTINLFWHKVANGLGEVASDEKYGQIMEHLNNIDDIGLSRVKDELGNEFMGEDKAHSLASEQPNYRVFPTEVNGKLEHSVVNPQENKWVVDLTTAMDRQKNTVAMGRELGKFLSSERTGPLKNTTNARDWFYKYMNKDFDVDGKKYVVRGMKGDDYIVEDLAGNRKRMGFDEVAEKTEQAKTAAKQAESDAKVVDDASGETTPPKTNDEPTYAEKIVQTKQERRAGGKYIKDNAEALDNPDLSSRKGRRKLKETLTEQLEKANEQGDEEALKNLNSALNYLRSKEKTSSHERVVGKRIRMMKDAGVKKERKQALDWMKKEGRDVNYSSLEDVRRAKAELHNEMDKVAPKADFSLNAKEGKEAESRMNNIARSLEMLSAREKEIGKGITKDQNLSDAQNGWLKGEDGRIDLWDEDAVESRLNYLNQLEDNPQTTASIEGYNSRQVKSVANFLEGRLKKIRDGGSSDFNSRMSEIADERTERRIRLKRQKALKARNDKFVSQLETIDKKLEEGNKRAYRSRVRKAKAKDEHIAKTGVQKGFAESVGLKKDDEDLADFAGGSIFTDKSYTKKDGDFYQVQFRGKFTEDGFPETRLEPKFKTKEEAIKYGKERLAKAGQYNPEEVKTAIHNAGGSRATDYGVLNAKDGKKRSVLKWDFKRNGENGRIYYMQNDDGSIDHFLLNRKPVHPNGGIDGNVRPSRFITLDGETRLNPYYKFVSPNKLTKASGELQGVSLADIEDPYPNLDGYIVKVGGDEDDLVANIQRPVPEGGVATKDHMIKNNHDAIRIERGGETYYKLVSKDQMLEREVLGDKSLQDVSKIEVKHQTPSYKAEGANPPKSYAHDGEKLADDLRYMGLKDNEILGKLEDAEFETAVKTHRKELEPSWKDEDLEKLVGSKDNVLVDGEIKERSIRKDEGGYYVLANKRKHYVNRPRKGAVLRSEEAVEKGTVRESEYEVGKEQVDKSALERGDLFSIRRDNHLRNGEVLGVNGDGSVDYTLFEANGKSKNKYKLAPDDFNLQKLYKPFAMSIGGLGVITLAEKLKLDNDEMGRVNEAMPDKLLTYMVVAGLVGSVLRKGYVKFAPEEMRVSTWRKKFVEYANVKTGRAETAATLGTNKLFNEAKAVRELGHEYEPNAKFGHNGAKFMAELLASGDDKVGSIEKLRKHKYIQSALSFARESDSKKAQEIGNFLEKIPRDIKIQRSNFEKRYNQEYGANAFNKYFNEEGLDKAHAISNEIHDKEISREKAYGQLNSAITRLMGHVLEYNEDGTASIKRRPEWMNSIYETAKKNGEDWDEFDRRLLQDPQTGGVLKSMREEFKSVEKTFKTGVINEELHQADKVFLSDKNLKIKHKGITQQFSEGQYRKLIDDFVVDYDGTWGEYVKDHKNQPFSQGLLKVAKKEDPAVQQLADVRKMGAKYTDGLREHYWPQKTSFEKINRIKQRDFIDNPEFATRDEAMRAFHKQIYEDFKSVNDVKAGRFLNFDNDREIMVEKGFEDGTEAVAFLANILDKAPQGARDAFNEKFGALSRVEAGTNPRKKAVSRLLEADVLKEDVDREVMENGREIPHSVYKLDPEAIDLNYSVGGHDKKFDLVEFANADEFGKQYENMMNRSFVKTSKFLENPRDYNMLPKYLETNVAKNLNSYSYDAGFRLKMIEAGIINENAMEREWWGPVKGELKQAGYQKEEIKENVGRLEDAYRIVGGLNPKISDAVDKEKAVKNLEKWRQASEIYRNFQYGRYGQSIAMLDMFQQGISTMPMTSFGSTLKANAKSTLNKVSALDNFIENSREYGIIKGTLEDLGPDVNGRIDHKRLATNGFSKLGNAANKLTHKTTHFNTGVWRWNGSKNKTWGRSIFENGGVRLLLDNAVGKNEVNLTANWIAHLYEARKVSKQWLKLQNGESLRGFSKGDVVRQFELLGVPASDMDYFAKQSAKMGEAFDHVGKNGGRMTDNMEPAFADMLKRVMHTATENYHGKNKMHRPTTWFSQKGKLWTTFNNFTYNQAFQLTQQRIRKPIEEWTQKYPSANRANLYSAGLFSKTLSGKARMKFLLKTTGLSKQAIEDMPLHALSTMGRAVFATGLSSVSNWTVRSAKGYFAYEAYKKLGLGSVSQQKLNNDGWGVDGKLYPDKIALNRQANLSDKIRLGDIQDPRVKGDIANTVTYSMAVTDRALREALDMGLAGPFVSGALRYGSMLPAGLSMALRLKDNLKDGVWKAVGGEYFKGENTPKLFYNVGRNFVPPLQLMGPEEYDK